MDASVLKNKVSEILQGAVSGRVEKYRTEDGFIRWGLVEREIWSEIDNAVQPKNPGDGTDSGSFNCPDCKPKKVCSDECPRYAFRA